MIDKFAYKVSKCLHDGHRCQRHILAYFDHKKKGEPLAYNEDELLHEAYDVVEYLLDVLFETNGVK